MSKEKLKINDDDLHMYKHFFLFKESKMKKFFFVFVFVLNDVNRRSVDNMRNIKKKRIICQHHFY